MDDDPGHILEIIKEAGHDLEAAAEQLGSTAGYLQSVLDRFEPAENAVDLEEFPLASGEAIPVQQLPGWLVKPLPKNAKSRSRWPSGAKSPSWFTRLSKCPRNHAQRYRHRRPDPSGLDAIVGNALHGAFQDAALLRLYKRKAPMSAGKVELLFHLEKQPEVVHDRGTEVLKRARRIVEDMEKPLELNNVWAAEFVWSFNASAGMLVAGIADLILVYLDPHNPNGPPLLVVVVDYKTGPSQVPTKEELRADPQACLELIWAKRYFHNAKRVQFKLWNVTLNQEITIDWDYELEAATLSFARACWHVWCQKIETANVTPRCRFCPYRSDCKAYTQDLQREAYREKGSLEEMEIDELMEANYRSKITEDLSNTRRMDTAKLILGKLGPGQRRYRGKRFMALQMSRKNPSFPSVSDVLFRLSEATSTDLKILLDACTSLGDGRKLTTWVQTLPEGDRKIVADMIEAMIQRRSSPPWIVVRDQGAVF